MLRIFYNKKYFFLENFSQYFSAHSLAEEERKRVPPLTSGQKSLHGSAHSLQSQSRKLWQGGEWFLCRIPLSRTGMIKTFISYWMTLLQVIGLEITIFVELFSVCSYRCFQISSLQSSCQDTWGETEISKWKLTAYYEVPLVLWTKPVHSLFFTIQSLLLVALWVLSSILFFKFFW